MPIGWPHWAAPPTLPPRLQPPPGPAIPMRTFDICLGGGLAPHGHLLGLSRAPGAGQASKLPPTKSGHIAVASVVVNGSPPYGPHQTRNLILRAAVVCARPRPATGTLVWTQTQCDLASEAILAEAPLAHLRTLRHLSSRVDDTHSEGNRHLHSCRFVRGAGAWQLLAHGAGFAVQARTLGNTPPRFDGPASSSHYQAPACFPQPKN